MKKKNSVLEKHGFKRLDRYPSKERLNEETAIQDFIVGKLAPNEPFISKERSITAFGSCFAGNVSRYLAAQGYSVNAHQWKHANSDFIRIDELMVHSPALLQQFQWAFEGRDLGEVFVGGKESANKSYHEVEKIRDIIADTDVFVVTFGLSEAWYDKQEKEYLWKFVPRKDIDPTRYENRVVSVAENIKNVAEIYKIIRKAKPDCEIIFTLSPIPLLGTYRDMPCVISNSISKASLRVALDEVFRENKEDENFHYFPSYEIVVNYLNDPFDPDNRHVSKETIAFIMKVFDEYYCHD